MSSVDPSVAIVVPHRRVPANDGVRRERCDPNDPDGKQQRDITTGHAQR
jgi:hypothetical protein